MFDYNKLWTLLSLQAVALVIPSVSFVIIFRNSVVGGRRSGILTALGLCFAIFCYIAFSIVGSTIITESSFLFHIIRYGGGFYLIWMGYSFWKDSGTFSAEMEESLTVLGGPSQKSGFGAIKTGFMVNILNPYILLFHFGTFSTIIPHTVPLGHKAIYAISLTVLSFLWFILLSVIFSNTLVRGFLRRHRQWTEGLTTLMLIFFGCQILFYWGIFHSFRGEANPHIKIVKMGTGPVAGEKILTLGKTH